MLYFCTLFETWPLLLILAATSYLIQPKTTMKGSKSGKNSTNSISSYHYYNPYSTDLDINPAFTGNYMRPGTAESSLSSSPSEQKSNHSPAKKTWSWWQEPKKSVPVAETFDSLSTISQLALLADPLCRTSLQTAEEIFLHRYLINRSFTKPRKFYNQWKFWFRNGEFVETMYWEDSMYLVETEVQLKYALKRILGMGSQQIYFLRNLVSPVIQCNKIKMTVSKSKDSQVFSAFLSLVASGSLLWSLKVSGMFSFLHDS